MCVGQVMCVRKIVKKRFVSVQILKTPQALSYHGVGPMVSARVHDLDILWARTFQLFDLCTKVGMLHIFDFSTVQHHSMYIGIDMMITTRTSQIVRRTSANGQQITNAQTSLLAPACLPARTCFVWPPTPHIPSRPQDLHASDALLVLDHLLPFLSRASHLCSLGGRTRRPSQPQC